MQKIWCINLEGGSREVDLAMVEKRKVEGWIVIPPEKLGMDGRPKQMYWASFDKNSPSREKRGGIAEEPSSKDKLSVELF